MNISYDRFIRTTDDYHVEACQKIFNKMYEKGDIYKGKYVGHYCKPCESFWTESQLVNGKLPRLRPPRLRCPRGSLLLQTSKYADRLLNLLENTQFMQPDSRKNEMVTFINQGLEDTVRLPHLLSSGASRCP